MGIAFPHSVPWIFWFALVAAAKATLLVFLSRRLRKAFPAVWDGLGRPFSFRGYSPSMSMNQGFAEQNAQWSLLFFVFSSQHRELHDRTVTILVWCARLACVLIVVLLPLVLTGSASTGQH